MKSIDAGTTMVWGAAIGSLLGNFLGNISMAMGIGAAIGAIVGGILVHIRKASDSNGNPNSLEE